MKCQLVVVLLAGALASCAIAPAPHSFESTAVVPRGYDAAWTDIIAFMASHNVPLKNIAKDSGVIYTERTEFSNEEADCGRPGMMTSSRRQASMNVFVRKVDDKNTSVTVNTSFVERRSFDGIPNDVICTSRGGAEVMILAAARGYL
jgi:hypothetical protein